MANLISRALIADIQADILRVPVIIILGPRQVGKSTLVKKLINYPKESVYLDLEIPSDEYKFSDAESYLRNLEEKLVIIDEVQRLPTLFPLIRALVDQHETDGRFILLGSASEHLIAQSTESLAGRSSYFELHPLNLFEVGAEHLNELWLKGGFPKAYKAESFVEARYWINQFIKTYIERELNAVYLKASSLQLEKFLQMLGSIHGQLCNYSMIAGSMDLSIPTVKRYIDFFNSCYLTRTIYPYFRNNIKRFNKITQSIYPRFRYFAHLERHT